MVVAIHERCIWQVGADAEPIDISDISPFSSGTSRNLHEPIFKELASPHICAMFSKGFSRVVYFISLANHQGLTHYDMIV